MDSWMRSVCSSRIMATVALANPHNTYRNKRHFYKFRRASSQTYIHINTYIPRRVVICAYMSVHSEIDTNQLK